MIIYIPPTILLAEDREDDVFFFRRVVQKLGVKNPLQVVTDGEEALNYFYGKGVFVDRKQYPLPCLAILDIKMPKYTGLEVCQKIRNERTFKDLPLVILSSSDDAKDKQQAIEVRANQYIVKPANFDTLVTELQAVFERWLPKR